MSAPYRCRFCGAASWVDPSDQTPPVDYCHPEDHGAPPCTDYRPDHNGECLNCDDGPGEHLGVKP